jgi:ferritin-like metal-binding protein YciE
MGFDSLEAVFSEQVNDLRSAEEQLIEALPKMAAAASSAELRKAFEEHLAQTRGHLERLDDVIASTGLSRTGEVCDGMRGLIKEGSKVIGQGGDPAAMDAALIAAAQRVEHYEIAGYGTAATLAEQLGHDHAQEILGQTLDEEETTDKQLTKLATGGMFKAGINKQAVR